MSAYQAIGKHFVSAKVVTRLIRARHKFDWIDGAKPDRDRLQRFLSIALDKVDGSYDYASYCGLQVLDLPDGQMADLTAREKGRLRDIMLVALMADLARFEVRASTGVEHRSPGMRPEPARAMARIRIALAVIRPSLERMGYQTPRKAVSTPEGITRLLDRFNSQIDPETRAQVARSLLPVHTLHDEIMFLRTLQAFEVNFAWIAVHLRNAVVLLAADPDAALERLREATGVLQETLRLMPLIGSMQPEAFHDFRRFTEGASAIQSSGYKAVEALCARPSVDRVDSPAYRSVPKVQSEVRAGMGTLEDAMLEARAAGRIPHTIDSDLVEAMSAFSDLLLKWRRAHFEIARRVLGGLEGTGYTEGVPYLDRVRDLPVFPRFERDQS